MLYLKYLVRQYNDDNVMKAWCSNTDTSAREKVKASVLVQYNT